MNDKPGKHPITDIIVHRIPTYGDETDIIIRALPEYMAMEQIYEWWEREIGHEGDSALALQKTHECYDQVSGWEKVNRSDAIPEIYEMRNYTNRGSDGSSEPST